MYSDDAKMSYVIGTQSERKHDTQVVIDELI